MHTKLRVHGKITMGTNLHRLIYNVLIDIVFPIFWHQLTLKNIRGRYAQHKGISRFN